MLLNRAANQCDKVETDLGFSRNVGNHQVTAINKPEKKEGKIEQKHLMNI